MFGKKSKCVLLHRKSGLVAVAVNTLTAVSCRIFGVVSNDRKCFGRKFKLDSLLQCVVNKN